MTLLETFKATLTKEIKPSQVVDVFQGQKFTLYLKGHQIGDTVTIQKFIDHQNKEHYVIPASDIRCDGLPDVNKTNWLNDHPRGAIDVDLSGFQMVTSRERSMASLLFGWASGK
ncbi:hypothetical protein [Paenibacillus sp. Leaf72]|uniref:hypothetical protein n=1 Tax=Paenibacillus sp. Leaf72 TaxID=1736234 RepID=UPI000701719F|nr:hypothetical protein [Paenibacillus sp. Leaf72]KQN96856.1 hypothetical protein ASF12_22570 [Paenibacillus sp. Leaf72]